MKAKTDPRHIARVEAVKALFTTSFGTKIKNVLKDEVWAQKKQIDEKIKKNAPAWPLAQIAPIDLAILRLALYELLYKVEKEPYKVIVDEAVEIAKEYGNESSGSFINGVLGAIIKEESK